MTDASDDRVLQGRYRLNGLVARGGMAEVWEATDDVLTRSVAVKILHPHLAADEAFRERFRREAVSAARLTHPNVVSTFDTGEDDGTAYIVMELIRGETLRGLLKTNGPLAPALVAVIGIQIAEALEHAHAAGIIHRDIKPANILICEPEPEAADSMPRIKVADFGIARAAAHDGADLTQPGALLGTAKYLAPEQVQGAEPDARSDVYALGIVLYELLTGRPPFSADTEMATAMLHVSAEPLRPRQLRAGIPRSLEAVVCKAMARDPDERYASAGDVATALRSVDLGADDAVPAVVRDPTPPSGLAPTFRQTERSWLVPAAVIVTVACVLVALGILFSRSDVGQELLGSGTGQTAGSPSAPVAPAAVHSFDPEGSPPEENEDKVALAIDGNPATRWTTDTYRSREFGALKKGVGLVIELAEPTSLRKLKVSSPTSGWSAAVYVADAPGARLEDWGEPIDVEENIGSSAEFDLKATEGRAVLLWITRLGADQRFEAVEVTVER